MVYGFRYVEKTRLVLRNLISGDENWLAHPLQRDEHESSASLRVLPTMSITPDNKEVLASYRVKYTEFKFLELLPSKFLLKKM
jgi:hypothetical protein